MQNTQSNVLTTAFAKRSLLLISSNFIRLLTQLAIIFIYSRRLSILNYGLYQSVWLYINIISTITLFGLPSILLSNSVSSIKTWIKLNKNIFIPALIAINLIPVIYLLAINYDYSFYTKLLLIAICITQNIAIIIETIAIKNENEKSILAINIFYALVYLLIHLYSIFYTFSLNRLLLYIVLLLLVKSILIGFFYTKKIEGPNSSTTIIKLGKQWFFFRDK